MIYSMTMFFEEYDLIDLKIKEESPYVDKIVIVESCWTHVGKLKSINFPVNKYKDNEKVVHLIIDDESVYADCDLTVERHARAIAERNYPLNKFPIADDDILIVADDDEIINGEQIEWIVNEAKKHGFVRLGMRAFYYYINVRQANDWGYAYAAAGWKCKQAPNLNWLRLQAVGPVLSNCGNHFGWLGGPEKIREKLQSTSHTEFNKPEIVSGIQERFENLEDVVGRKDQGPLTIVSVDHLYPNTILNNMKEWKKYVRNKET